MTKLMANFAIFGAVEGAMKSVKVAVEVDPGAMYEHPEKTVRNAEDRAVREAHMDVLFATYYEGLTQA